MPRDMQKISDALLGTVGQGETLYALLDSARKPEIALRLRGSNLEYDSLYRGRSEETMWDVAPYLVRWEPSSEFFSWVLQEGWGESWGIFLTSTASLEELCKHFRQFLLATLEDGRQVYFRFYDPRVLRVFLPTCTLEETSRFFGPVLCYLIESEQTNLLLKFTADKRMMELESVSLFDSGRSDSEV